MVKVNQNGAIVEYAAAVKPIKKGNKFLPNTAKLKKQFGIVYGMVKKGVEEMQKEGRTILINKYGGWCYTTDEIQLVK